MNRPLVAFVICLSLGTSPARARADDAALEFQNFGAKLPSLDPAALAKLAPLEVVATEDPYYRKKKRFSAVPIAPVLEAVFGQPRAALQKNEFVLIARDGYKVPISGQRLFEPGGYIAVADADRAKGTWEPIASERNVNPGPYYMIWKGSHQRTLETHPRPWQLLQIAMVSFDEIYPHTLPGKDANELAQKGALRFRDRCIKCHAINREGGRVGPDLNVPQSIVEYRPEAQIRAYIKDPRAFRYGAMPGNPDFDERAFDELLAYFRVMSARKHDPEGKATKP